MSLRHVIVSLVVVLLVSTAAMTLSLNLSLPWLLGFTAAVVLPLALLLPGLWRARLESYRLGSMLSVFYVGYALTEAVARPQLRWLPALMLLSATALVAALILAIRRYPAPPSSSARRE